MSNDKTSQWLFTGVIIGVAVGTIICILFLTSCKKESTPVQPQTTYCVDCNYTGTIPDSQQCDLTNEDADNYMIDAAEYASYNNQSVNCTKHEQ